MKSFNVNGGPLEWLHRAEKNTLQRNRETGSGKVVAIVFKSESPGCMNENEIRGSLVHSFHGDYRPPPPVCLFTVRCELVCTSIIPKPDFVTLHFQSIYS